MSAKLKSFIRSDQSFFALLVCLVGVASYGLGQQSTVINQTGSEPANQQAGVIFIDTPEQEQVDRMQVVASKSGTKYHKLDCPGATTIKEANLIRFASTDLARAAGYEPAGNCPGLK